MHEGFTSGPGGRVVDLLEVPTDPSGASFTAPWPVGQCGEVEPAMALVRKWRMGERRGSSKRGTGGPPVILK